MADGQASVFVFRLKIHIPPGYDEQVRYHAGNWFLLHDNAPARRTAVVREFLAKKEILVDQPYSPDLAPCDYFSFPRKF
ncbi:hypothetical protein WH47_04439 [Habropoda laboriosa]|uniref:Histone-lysine N-methyltransferase SETMAR n=1 Tax=Habropoda laboriosa TaxID=597456 RepID=A0A0L7QWX9_9HYME|nr:hypothetical protein WH47_04439 [Habropoda laboriosa]